jgi:hypothetical protein
MHSVIYPHAHALSPNTFLATIRLGLCTGFESSGAAIEIKYKIGDNPTIYPLEIISQSISTNADIGTFQVELPNSHGTTPLHVFAQCRNTYGVSEASNSMSISNCDALSIRDSDNDGIPDNIEDTSCSNSYTPGDLSNANHFDSDGDGTADLVELLHGTDPSDASSSPRPWVFMGAPFDPDGSGNSNPVAFRPHTGTWYVKDFIEPGNHISFQHGMSGDIPIAYNPNGHTSNVGVIRNMNNQLVWFLRGAGFEKSNGFREVIIPFGLWGDHIVLGPWEKPGVTNPAVARLINNYWFYFIYMSDGSIRIHTWGYGNDVPKIQDYDGDGIFDLAVYRPSEQKTYVIHSRDGSIAVYAFGTGSSDYTFRGDVTGDGKDDLTFWEPINGMFHSMISEYFDPNHFISMQLGLYYIHLPMSWNKQNGKVLLTVVDHALGLRYFRTNNDEKAAIEWVQWGLHGDALG